MSEQRPKPKPDLSPLPPESDEELTAAAQYSDGDKARAAEFVAGLTVAGEVARDGRVQKIPSGVLRELWNAKEGESE